MGIIFMNQLIMVKLFLRVQWALVISLTMLYMLTNNVIYLANVLNGEPLLWESTDNGKTFVLNESLPLPASSEAINNIYADPESKIIYLGTDHGLYESTDNGSTFTQNTSFSGTDFVKPIYAYKNVVYVMCNNGLYESNDNGKTFVETCRAIPNSICSFQNNLYVSTEKGLYETTTISYASVNQPSQVLNKSNYLIYNEPIKFDFDWNFLSKVTIDIKNTKIIKTLTSGSYQIKDDGLYTVIFYFKNGLPITETFYLKNGFDFKNGVNGLTFSKGSIDLKNNQQIWNLDLYLNGVTASELMTLTGSYEPKYADDALLDVLTDSRAAYMGTKVWTDAFSNSSLKDSINNDGAMIHKTTGVQGSSSIGDILTGDLYDFLSSGDDSGQSILDHGADAPGATAKKYRANLNQDINDKNKSQSGQIGIDLHFELEYSKKWVCSNFDYGVPNDAYNKIVQITRT